MCKCIITERFGAWLKKKLLGLQFVLQRLKLGLSLEIPNIKPVQLLTT